MAKPGKASRSAARSARLAAALRENLKRRKAQVRGRASETVPDAADAAAPAGADRPAAPDFRRNPGGKLEPPEG